MKLQIICRGSKREGLGHLFRARTFARAACAAHDVQVIAITEPDLDNILADLPCTVRFVARDAEVFEPLQAFAPDVLVCDLTHLDVQTFLDARRQVSLTVSISPVFEHMPLVDALFTRAVQTPPLPGVHLFAGLHYAVFGEQCRPVDEAAYDHAVDQAALPIAVCMGGADAANKTLKVVQALVRRSGQSTIWVLLGEGYAHSYNALVEAARGRQPHEVILAKTSRSMWNVLGNCALGVLAGGLTTVEAVYAGLPSINLFERREHWAMVQELFDAGVCLNGGLFSEDSLATMTAMVDRLDRDRHQLRRMRGASRGLIDGHGSERIINGIERLLADRTPAPPAVRETECEPQPC